MVQDAIDRVDAIIAELWAIRSDGSLSAEVAEAARLAEPGLIVLLDALLTDERRAQIALPPWMIGRCDDRDGDAVMPA